MIKFKQNKYILIPTILIFGVVMLLLSTLWFPALTSKVIVDTAEREETREKKKEDKKENEEEDEISLIDYGVVFIDIENNTLKTYHEDVDSSYFEPAFKAININSLLGFSEDNSYAAFEYGQTAVNKKENTTRGENFLLIVESATGEVVYSEKYTEFRGWINDTEFLTVTQQNDNPKLVDLDKEDSYVYSYEEIDIEKCNTNFSLSDDEAWFSCQNLDEEDYGAHIYVVNRYSKEMFDAAELVTEDDEETAIKYIGWRGDNLLIYNEYGIFSIDTVSKNAELLHDFLGMDFDSENYSQDFILTEDNEMLFYTVGTHDSYTLFSYDFDEELNSEIKDLSEHFDNNELDYPDEMSIYPVDSSPNRSEVMFWVKVDDQYGTKTKHYLYDINEEKFIEVCNDCESAKFL